MHNNWEMPIFRKNNFWEKNLRVLSLKCLNSAINNEINNHVQIESSSNNILLR